jgi:hypothetical protein
MNGTPITTRIRQARKGVEFPQGMKISISADGTGPIVPDVNPSPAKACGCKK